MTIGERVLCALRYWTTYGMRCVDEISEDGMFKFSDKVNFKCLPVREAGTVSAGRA